MNMNDATLVVSLDMHEVRQQVLELARHLEVLATLIAGMRTELEAIHELLDHDTA